MVRCQAMSSVSNEQCREPQGHPCLSSTRFHRYAGPLAYCDLKGYCAGPDDHSGDCRTVAEQLHHQANPNGCGNQRCFTCVHIVYTMLPEGCPLHFPMPQQPPPASPKEG